MFLNSLSLAIEYKFLAAQYCKFNEIPCLSYRFFIAAARAWNDNKTLFIPFTLQSKMCSR